MQPEPKPHVSHWIAWSIIILVVGVAGFFGWRYFDEITTIYDNTFVASIRSYKKTTTATSTSTAVATSKFTNTNFRYSITIPSSWELLAQQSAFIAADGVAAFIQSDIAKTLRAANNNSTKLQDYDLSKSDYVSVYMGYYDTNDPLSALNSNLGASIVKNGTVTDFSSTSGLAGKKFVGKNSKGETTELIVFTSQPRIPAVSGQGKPVVFLQYSPVSNVQSAVTSTLESMAKSYSYTK